MAKTKANEPEFQGQAKAWIDKEIDKGGLPFKNATINSSLYSLPRVKFPDVLVTLDFECQQPYCGWELKTPKTDARDKELLKDAVKKAQTLNAKYFVTWNMQTAIIWKTPPKTRTTVQEKNKLREFGPDPRIQNVGDIRDSKKAIILQDTCRRLLLDLAKLYHDENINLPVADTTFFVELVGNAADRMTGTIRGDLNKAKSNKNFDKRLNAWAKKQGVSKYDQEYYETLAQQISYKIIGKILFYITLRKQNPGLPRLELAADNYKASEKKMRGIFQQALGVDYQAIFETDITDEIELSAETVKIIVQLAENLTHWSFELMPLDVIGHIFERLIPEDARHTLGQYFTPDNLVDLIISFCVNDGDDHVMDPTCGTGTFLIRAYQRLKYLRLKVHHNLLNQAWGFDIAGFPAELATINLYRQDLSDYLNFPRVLQRDFFEVMPGDEFEFPPPKKTAQTGERIKVKIPKFDALVGNFPFIRQELIEQAEKGYKKKLEEVLFESWGKEYPELFRAKSAGKKNKTTHDLQLSGQADIYAYLFFHTASHLKNGGRMGFITSNSWLDVAYGYELQRFFLSKFKIVAICESRCEPWFEQSAVNTVFTILERCYDDVESKNNLVRFVKIKKPLGQLFPQDALLDAQGRWIGLEGFVAKVEGVAASGDITESSGCKKFGRINKENVKCPEIISYEDDEVRIRLIRQRELIDEVEAAGQTVKWGQYLRAPDIHFEILEKCADKFVPLSEVANIRRGITTGINEFFYLTEDKIKHWGIEKEFLKPVIKSPKECAGVELIKAKDLKLSAFICHKIKKELKGTKALKYIKWGETQSTKGSKPWPQVQSVKDRKNWYELPKRTPSLLLLPMVTGNSLRCIMNKGLAQVDHNLFEVICDDSKIIQGLAIFLNSGNSFLERELIGRANLGDGALKVEGIDWKRILVPDKDALLKLRKDADKAFDKLCGRAIKDIKTESKRKDRIEFEEVVLKSLGLQTNSVKEILSSVVGLVEERHLLPKLRTWKKKKRFEQDLDKLREEVSNEVLPDGAKKFPDGFVKGWGQVECEEISVPEGKLRLGESFFDKQDICDADGNRFMETSSIEKGKFIVYAKMKGSFVVRVPTSGIIVKKAIQDYEAHLKETKEKIYTAFMEKCGDRNVSENLTRQVFEEFGLPDVD